VIFEAFGFKADKGAKCRSMRWIWAKKKDSPDGMLQKLQGQIQTSQNNNSSWTSEKPSVTPSWKRFDSHQAARSKPRNA
jgi:hypothetical protein